MIIVYGQPQGKARPKFRRIGNFVSTYTPKQTKEYEKQIADAWEEQTGDFEISHTFYKAEMPLAMTIKAYYEIPKSFSKTKRQQALNSNIRPLVKPDIDNIIKVVADALNEVAYADDKQIVKIICAKYYSEEPRIEVDIKEIKD